MFANYLHYWGSILIIYNKFIKIYDQFFIIDFLSEKNLVRKGHKNRLLIRPRLSCQAFMSCCTVKVVQVKFTLAFKGEQSTEDE